jgi:hypothetical protein
MPYWLNSCIWPCTTCPIIWQSEIHWNGGSSLFQHVATTRYKYIHKLQALFLSWFDAPVGLTWYPSTIHQLLRMTWLQSENPQRETNSDWSLWFHSYRVLEACGPIRIGCCNTNQQVILLFRDKSETSFNRNVIYQAYIFSRSVFWLNSLCFTCLAEHSKRPLTFTCRRNAKEMSNVTRCNYLRDIIIDLTIFNLFSIHNSSLPTE